MGANLILSATGDSETPSDGSEFTVFTGTVPGGTIGTDNLLTIRMLYDWINNTGGATTYTLRVKYGGVTVHTDTSLSFASDANRRGGTYLVFLGGAGATNAQRWGLEAKAGGVNSAAGGTGNGNDHHTVTNVSTVDTTSDQTLSITAQMASANANLLFRRRGVWVERVNETVPSVVGDGTQLITLKTFDTQNGEGVVKGTTTETSVWTTTIPANTIGSGNLVIARLIADVKHGSGSANQWWHNVYYNGSLVFNPIVGVNQSTASGRYSFPLEVWLGGAGATNAQRMGVIGHAIGSNAGSGDGNLGNTSWQANQSTNATSVDQTSDRTLEFRVDFNNANADVVYMARAGIVAVIKA